MSMDQGRISFQKEYQVPERHMQYLDTYVGLLIDWQKAKNLVSPSTIQNLWSRHIADSYQLAALARSGSHWLDIGSGAGLPGMVVASTSLGEDCDSVSTGSFSLVEANGRKCAFLRAVSRETNVSADIINQRIESIVLEELRNQPDYLTARALAPLEKLCSLMEPLMAPKTVALVHKGQDFVVEIEKASKYWDFDVLQHKSRVDKNSVILAISNLSRR